MFTAQLSIGLLVCLHVSTFSAVDVRNVPVNMTSWTAGKHLGVTWVPEVYKGVVYDSFEPNDSFIRLFLKDSFKRLF